MRFGSRSNALAIIQRQIMADKSSNDCSPRYSLSLLSSLLIFQTACLANHPLPCVYLETQAHKESRFREEAAVCPCLQGRQQFQDLSKSSPHGQTTLVASHTQLLRFSLRTTYSFIHTSTERGL